MILSIATQAILLDMVARAQNPRVALVHQMPFCADQPGFVNAVDKVCFTYLVSSPPFFSSLALLGSARGLGYKIWLKNKKIF